MTMASVRHLEVWDYVSMGCLVVLSSAVGLYHVFTAGRRSKGTKEFLVSSTDLGFLPLVLSTMATFFSAIGMLGFPAEIYMNGVIFVFVSLAVVIQLPVGIFLYLPVFFKLNKNTIFECLELRFCKSVRICTSLILTVQSVFLTAIVMYAPALALNQVTGLQLWPSVLSIGLICVIYTSLGGFRAIVWADVTQCVVYIVVMLIIIIRGITSLGGFSYIWEKVIEGKRDEIAIWRWSEHTSYSLWTMIIAFPIHMIGVVVIKQTLMQRYLSRKTLKQSQILFVGASISIVIGQLLISLLGLIAYANYYDCDPLLSGRVRNRDQILALYAVDALSFCTGLPGVFVAGIMCATLSTLSSTLNSLAAVTLSDYVKAFKPQLSEQTSIKLSRIFVVFYGVVCVALVALAEKMGGIVTALFAVAGITGGPVVTVFTVGMLLPSVNSNGAKFGFFCSMVLPVWAYVGRIMTSPLVPHAPISADGCATPFNVTSVVREKGLLDDFYTMPTCWFTCWSLVVGIVTALVYTKITGSAHNVDPDLLFPFVRKYAARKCHQDLRQMDEIKQHVAQPLIYKQQNVF